MAKLSIRDLDLTGKRVFIRVDFNVPLKDGAISDDTRIRASLPTIQLALEHGATVVLASHLGRPKGKADPAFSLEAGRRARLGELLGRPVAFADDCIGDAARAAVDAGPRGRGGGVVLLENLRFHPEEEKNDAGFAAALAALADVYVNDAFGAAHRAHASVDGIARHAAAGGRRAADGEGAASTSGHALESPERPFVAILGGAKVSDKIEVIENLLATVDACSSAARWPTRSSRRAGMPVGKSLVEDDKLDAARDDHRARGRRAASRSSCRSITSWPTARRRRRRRDAGGRRPGDRRSDGRRHRPGDGRDCTPALIADAKTVVWNGPMGVFEIAPFAAGTNAVAQRRGRRARARRSSAAATRSPAVTKAGVADRITHISTGGGASLEFLGGARAARRGGAAGQDVGSGSAVGRISWMRRTMRTQPFIAGNWKMFKTVQEAVVLREGAPQPRQGRRRTSRSSSRRRSRRCTRWPRRRATRNVGVAAQDLLLGARGRVHRRGQRRRCCKEAGAAYVIIGHSERRTLFGETDATVNRKTLAALARRADADRLHRRDARGARARRDVRRARPADQGRASTACPAEQVGGAGRRLRAGLGDRHRPQRHAGAGRRGARAHPRAAAAVVRRRRGRARAASSTAAA